MNHCVKGSHLQGCGKYRVCCPVDQEFETLRILPMGHFLGLHFCSEALGEMPSSWKGFKCVYFL